MHSTNGYYPKELIYVSLPSNQVYENSTYCKPTPDYYRELIEKLDLDPEKCIMVGNDTSDDMVAEKLGIKVFLLTDCLINTKNEDINKYPHGNFEDLAEYIKNSL